MAQAASSRTGHPRGRDPRGYYRALGLGPNAPPAAVKAAYRDRAKALHPDRNKAADAAQAFQRVNEAYRVLSDPRKRALYDSGGDPATPAETAPRRPPWPHACQSCRTVTAQPRLVVFEMVQGRLWRSLRRTIQGVYCRRCADHIALKASLVTWALGWWSLPFGPVHSLRALFVNMMGGRKPRDANARLLAQQALAMLARGETELARALAEQAKGFLRDGENEPATVNRIHSLLARLPPRPGRRLRNRWRPWGRAFAAQAAPLAVLLAVSGLLANALLVQAVPSGPETVQTPPPVLQAPPLADGATPLPAAPHHVVRDGAPLHAGPGERFPVLDTLERFTGVDLLDMTPQGDWMGVRAPGGDSGFVRAEALAPGDGETARLAWCREGTDQRPENGAVLLRAMESTGPHSLHVVNRSGRDALVKLKERSGRTALSLFVGAGARATAHGVEGGVYRVVYAQGETFSRTCATFLSGLETLAFPDLERLETQSAREPDARRAAISVVLPPRDARNRVVRPIPAESFLRDDAP